MAAGFARGGNVKEEGEGENLALPEQSRRLNPTGWLLRPEALERLGQFGEPLGWPEISLEFSGHLGDGYGRGSTSISGSFRVTVLPEVN